VRSNSITGIAGSDLKTAVEFAGNVDRAAAIQHFMKITLLVVFEKAPTAIWRPPYAAIKWNWMLLLLIAWAHLRRD
jgi:hypothetical protein